MRIISSLTSLKAIILPGIVFVLCWQLRSMHLYPILIFEENEVHIIYICIMFISVIISATQVQVSLSKHNRLTLFFMSMTFKMWC